MEDEKNMELAPKSHSKRAPSGMRTFTVCRQADETGVSGDGIIAEGVEWGDGSVSLRWLTPWPKGSLVFWHTLQDFLNTHVIPHPSNGTIITFGDGERFVYGTTGEESHGTE